MALVMVSRVAASEATQFAYLRVTFPPWDCGPPPQPAIPKTYALASTLPPTFKKSLLVSPCADPKSSPKSFPFPRLSTFDRESSHRINIILAVRGYSRLTVQSLPANCVQQDQTADRRFRTA